MPYKIPLLQADDIEVKVKKVTEKGAVALLYKTARTDMNILDDVFGAENWSCEYDEVKGNLYCTIRVRNEHGEWVGKQDCGIESREDGDGNEKKGEASDAFKRAGFRWGIGRELYTAPFTFLPLQTYKDGNGYKLKNPFERFAVSEIGYDENRRINRLVITNNKGVVMYTMGGKPPQRKASISPAMRPDPKNDPPFEQEVIDKKSETTPHSKRGLIEAYRAKHKLTMDEMQASYTAHTERPLADVSFVELQTILTEMEKQ